jgi:hypothetical protein
MDGDIMEVMQVVEVLANSDDDAKWFFFLSRMQVLGGQCLLKNCLQNNIELVAVNNV